MQNNGKLTGLENFSRGLSSGDAKNTFREVYSRNDTTQLKLIKSDTDRRIRTAYLFAANLFLSFTVSLSHCIRTTYSGKARDYRHKNNLFFSTFKYYLSLINNNISNSASYHLRIPHLRILPHQDDRKTVHRRILIDGQPLFPITTERDNFSYAPYAIHNNIYCKYK